MRKVYFLSKYKFGDKFNSCYNDDYGLYLQVNHISIEEIVVRQKNCLGTKEDVSGVRANFIICDEIVTD